MQRPLPIVVGGHSRAALRRAARHADGWYGFLVGLQTMAEYRDGLRAAAERAGRERPLHISISPSRRLDAETVGRYAELGVDRLIVIPRPGLSLEAVLEFVEANAPERLGATAA